MSKAVAALTVENVTWARRISRDGLTRDFVTRLWTRTGARRQPRLPDVELQDYKLG